MYTQKEIGQRIRAWRKRQGLTQAMLGDRLGVGQAQISSIELGEAFSMLPQLIELADLMEISLDELVGRNVVRENGTGEGADREVSVRLSALHNLIDLVITLPADQQARLLDVARVMFPPE